MRPLNVLADPEGHSPSAGAPPGPPLAPGQPHPPARMSRAANCGFGRGCGDQEPARPAAPQGASGAERGHAAGAELDVAALARNHPCYGEDAHHHFARMHVAVAPICNVQCHYCHRKYDCANESRPGVVSERLSPEDAVRKVLAVAAEIPELSVVGIAGPGDALANPDATFATLEGIRRAAPDLTLCVSTNGLALPEHADRLVDAGVRHVTVTVNMTDPDVGERIYPWIVLGGRKVRGREASRILSARQLAGVARLRARGVLVKVNSVVIPGVNDAHLPEVARAVRSAGAFVVNLVPLISSPEHGTHYGLTGRRGPTAEELERVQGACETDARLMRHCRQCRADAVGRLGEDRFEAFTLARLPPGPAQDARDLRAERRELAERARAIAARARNAALLRVAGVEAGVSARIAVASREGGLVDQHFGHAREFLVYEVDRTGARLVGRRAVDRYCGGEEGDDDALAAALRALAGCRAVLVARVGRCPAGQLAAAGIEAVSDHAHQPIEAAALAWFEAFAARAARGGGAPAPAAPVPDARGEAA